MIESHASTVATQMVELHSFGNRAEQHMPHRTMSGALSAEPWQIGVAVAIDIECALPVGTPSRGVRQDVRPEPFQRLPPVPGSRTGSGTEASAFLLPTVLKEVAALFAMTLSIERRFNAASRCTRARAVNLKRFLGQKGRFTQATGFLDRLERHCGSSPWCQLPAVSAVRELCM